MYALWKQYEEAAGRLGMVATAADSEDDEEDGSDVSSDEHGAEEDGQDEPEGLDFDGMDDTSSSDGDDDYAEKVVVDDVVTLKRTPMKVKPGKGGREPLAAAPSASTAPAKATKAKGATSAAPAAQARAAPPAPPAKGSQGSGKPKGDSKRKGDSGEAKAKAAPLAVVLQAVDQAVTGLLGRAGAPSKLALDADSSQPGKASKVATAAAATSRGSGKPSKPAKGSQGSGGAPVSASAVTDAFALALPVSPPEVPGPAKGASMKKRKQRADDDGDDGDKARGSAEGTPKKVVISVDKNQALGTWFS